MSDILSVLGSAASVAGWANEPLTKEILNRLQLTRVLTGTGLAVLHGPGAGDTPPPGGALPPGGAVPPGGGAPPAPPPPGSPPPGGGAPGAGAGPSDVRDMAVPEDVLNLVMPYLVEYNIQVRAETVNSTFGSARVHRAVNGSFNTYLIHIHKDVMENAQLAPQLAPVFFIFKKGDHIRVLSKDCYNAALAYDLAWTRWTDGGIETAYVDWRKISGLNGLAEPDRPEVFHSAFAMPATLKRRALLQPQDLAADPSAFGQLVGIFTRLSSTTSPGDVNGYFNNLLLGTVPDSLRNDRNMWANGFEPASKEFCSWLIGKGVGADGNAHLGAVLIATLEKIGDDDRRITISIIDRFKLVAAADRIKALRKQYLNEQ
jgi:hypothetical protein